MLAFEKEVLGIYVSGHPLEEYAAALQSQTTAVTTDFNTDEETGETRVKDGQVVTIGGMIDSKTVKVTKNNRMMAFLNVEDLYGTVEVIVFPNDYEKNKNLLSDDEKILVRGRVSASEEQQAKLVCEKVMPLKQAPRQLWIQFEEKQEFLRNEQKLYDIIVNHDGVMKLLSFVRQEKQ